VPLKSKQTSIQTKTKQAERENEKKNNIKFLKINKSLKGEDLKVAHASNPSTGCYVVRLGLKTKQP
jgi:hypothetical protein